MQPTPSMMHRIIMVLLSYVALMISVNIYTNWRGYHNGLFSWIDVLFPLKLSTGWTGIFGSEGKSFLLYNLPDGLWMFSLCSFILAIWGLSLHIFSGIWLCFAFIIGVTLEIFQNTGAIAGTFDWFDIYAYTFALLSAIIFSQILKNLKWKSG